MPFLNRVFLMGNLTRKPELRYTPGGAAVCEFGLAVNRRFTVNGQEKEETCFIDIVVWGRQAESCDRFLNKGSLVFAEGRLQLDQWEDKETGGKRSRLRVVAERINFLGGRGEQPREDYQGQGQQDYNGGRQDYGRPQQQGFHQSPPQEQGFQRPPQQGFQQAPPQEQSFQRRGPAAQEPDQQQRGPAAQGPDQPQRGPKRDSIEEAGSEEIEDDIPF